jgi:hypothetical protein
MYRGTFHGLSARLALCLLALLLAVPAAAGPAARLLNAATPPALTPVARIGGASEVVAAGAGFVYVGDGQAIIVADVRGATILPTARLEMPGLVQAAEIADTLLAVGAGNEVVLLSIADRAQPARLGVYSTGSAVWTLALQGSTLYVGTEAGLDVVDVRNPAAPSKIGGLARLFGVIDLLTGVGELYAVSRPNEPSGAGGTSVLRLNVSNPATPAVLKEGSISGGSLGTGVAGIALTNGLLYAVGDTSGPHCAGCQSFEVWALDPITLEERGKTGFGIETTQENATSVVAYGEYLLAVSSAGGLNVLAVEDPTNMRRVARLPLSYLHTSVAVVGQRAYVANYFGGVQQFNLGDPLQPAAGPKLSLFGPVYEAALSETTLTALGAYGRSGLTTLAGFDLRNLAAPEPFALLPQDVVSLRDGAGGLNALYKPAGAETRLVDVRAPGRLSLGGALSLNTVLAAAARGDNVYLAVNDETPAQGQAADELVVLSAAEVSPAILGRVGVISLTLDLALEDDRLYRLSSQGRLEVYGLANPSQPQLLGSVGVGDVAAFNSSQIAVSGGVVYVGKAQGVQVVDARNPAAPTLGALIVANHVEPAVAADRGRLVILGTTAPDNVASLEVYGLANPLAPALLASTSLPDRSRALSVAGGRIAVPLSAHGVAIYALFDQTVGLPLLGR